MSGYLIVYDSYVGQRHSGSIDVAHMTKYGITSLSIILSFMWALRV